MFLFSIRKQSKLTTGGLTQSRLNYGVVEITEFEIKKLPFINRIESQWFLILELELSRTLNKNSTIEGSTKANCWSFSS
jgi:hypothetical protein